MTRGWGIQVMGSGKFGEVENLIKFFYSCTEVSQTSCICCAIPLYVCKCKRVIIHAFAYIQPGDSCEEMESWVWLSDCRRMSQGWKVQSYHYHGFRSILANMSILEWQVKLTPAATSTFLLNSRRVIVARIENGQEINWSGNYVGPRLHKRTFDLWDNDLPWPLSVLPKEEQASYLAFSRRFPKPLRKAMRSYQKPARHRPWRLS